MPPQLGQTPQLPGQYPDFATHNLKSTKQPVLKVAVVGLALLLLITLILAATWLSKYHSAKTVSDAAKAEITAAARVDQIKLDDAKFAEMSKSPYRSYVAPTTLADLKVSFPKSWNLYTVEDSENDLQLDLYWNENAVASPDNFKGDYALRLQLSKTSYADTVSALKSQAADGSLKVRTIKISGLSGTQYVGKINADKTGIMVILPIRDKSLSIWTEGSGAASDFVKILGRLRVNP